MVIFEELLSTAVVKPTVTDWIIACTTTLSAFGALLIAVLAIWGPWIQRMWIGPSLTLEIHHSAGSYCPLRSQTETTGHGWFFHLRARNTREGSTARGIRAFVVKIEEVKPNNNIIPAMLSIPHLLRWAPAELGLMENTITDCAVLDFVAVIKPIDGQSTLSVLTAAKSFDFPGDFTPPATFRYWVQIESENARPHRAQAFDVAWNGEWSDRAEEMGRHIQVKRV